MPNLYAIVEREQNTGIQVTPHKYSNGKYHVAKKKGDKPVEVNLNEIESFVKRGFGVRMSNNSKRHPPGLFRAMSIRGVTP